MQCRRAVVSPRHHLARRMSGERHVLKPAEFGLLSVTIWFRVYMPRRRCGNIGRNDKAHDGVRYSQRGIHKLF